jgi:hypothetical protein
MGYVREQAGITVSGSRSVDSWRFHLEECKATILQAADLCHHQGKALVLGSGPLLDVPLAELSRRFEEVVLADIVHLRQARKQARCYANVRLIQIDVTGVTKTIFDLARRRKPVSLPEHRPDFFLDEKFDLVASVNLLSQLPVIPGRYLTAGIGGLSVDAKDDFSRKLIEKHLDWLARFPGVVCLITDRDRLEIGGSKILIRKKMLWGVDLPKGGRSWIWDIAPRPAIYRDRDVRHKVIAFADFPKTDWIRTIRQQGQARLREPSR